MTTILDAALALYDAGFCVLPAMGDGTKRPAGNWKQYQTSRPSREQTYALVERAEGIGVLCGAVSGNVEMLEVEGEAIALMPEVAAAMRDHDLAEVWHTILNGYAEQTPGGGIHWLLRIVGGPALKNTKLASRPAPKPDNPHYKQVLFETRGEGGWVVTAPSGGTTHETGRAWQLVAGGPTTIPTISADDRDAVYAVLSLFDQTPVSNGPRPQASATEASGERPGDDFNATAQWEDILDGWTVVRPMGKGKAWRRPGKNVGISATTGQSDDGVDRLYVFTTSTVFPSETPLTKFAAYAHLCHGGDFGAAARELRRQGYGAPANPGMTLAEMVETPRAIEAAPQPTDDKPADPPSFIERTEDAQALALVATCGHLIRYNITSGRWHAFLSGVWVEQPSGGGHVREYARGLARGLPEGDNGATRWRAQMLSDTGVRHVISMAASDQRVVTQATDFDTDPYLIGSGQIVTDLRTGQQRPSQPSDMISRQAGVVPGTQGAAAWQAFLDSILDPEAQKFLQRLFGLSLYGAVLEHVLIFLFGTGANGKTTFMDALRHAAGQLAVSLPAETLMVRRHEAHSTELAPLAGARLAVFNELPAGMRFDEARVKMLTGGDQVNARWLYGQPFSFTPSHSLWIVGNDKPATTSGGEAFWRRVRLVGFHRTIAAEQRDPNLPEKLREAAPAILQWGIDGWAEYQRIGLADPASVVADTAEYRAENDTVGRFLDECCQVSGNESLKVNTRAVRSAYETWCKAEGLTAVTPQVFGRELGKSGVNQIRSHGQRLYVGLTLLAGEDQQEQTWP